MIGNLDGEWFYRFRWNVTSVKSPSTCPQPRRHEATWVFCHSANEKKRNESRKSSIPHRTHLSANVFHPGIRSNVESQRILKPFSLNTRQSEAETRPQPSTRAKWLGEPVWTRQVRVEPATRACARRARRDRRVVVPPPGSPRKNIRIFDFPKNQEFIKPDESQGIFGDIRRLSALRTFISRYSFAHSSFGQLDRPDGDITHRRARR